MKKLKRIIAVFLIMLTIASVCSACSKNGSSGSDSSSPAIIDNLSLDPNKEIVYSPEELPLPELPGKASYFCLSDNSLYLASVDDEASYLARMNLQTSNWEPIDSANISGKAQALCENSGILYILTFDGSQYLLYTMSASDNSDIRSFSLTIPAEDRVRGMHIDSSGVLIWSNSGSVSNSALYQFSLDSAELIREKELKNMWFIDGVFTDKSSTYAIIGSTSFEKPKPISLEDVFSDKGNFLDIESVAAYVQYTSSAVEGCFLVDNDFCVCRLNLSDGSINRLFSWADIGVGTYFGPAIYETSDGIIYYFDPQRDLLLRLTPHETEKRKIIVLATSGYGDSLGRLIGEFNNKNSEYKIEMQQYDFHDSDRLRTEIIAGKGPDIVDVWTIPLSGDVNKLFVDLLPYIENDADISVNDFIPNVFEAAKIDGALYYAMPTFNIRTVAVADEAAVESKGSGFDEYVAQFKNYDKKSTAVNQFSHQLGPNEILLNAFPIIWKDIVTETENGIPVVDKALLAKWLEFCKTAPSYGLDFETIYGWLRIKQVSINMEADAKFIGYPSEKSGGACALPELSCFAMLANSEHKEAAWEFIKSALSYEYQNEDPFGIPTRIDSFEKILKDSLANDEPEMKISEADCEKMRKIVESVDIVYFGRHDLAAGILAEEAAGYFSGQVGLEDVVNAISSRLDIYLSEQFG